VERVTAPAPGVQGVSGAPGAPGADGALQPLPRQQRIGAVDVLRGFALLGVVVVNTQAFAGHIPPPPGTLGDQVAAWLVAWLLTAKSYSLFSLLFGLGFAIQMERAEAKGQDFVPFFRRRCLILFLIGVANAVLLFEGDILTLYAILGFALLLFRRSAPATLVRWAVGLLILAAAFNLMGAFVFASVPQAAGEAAAVADAEKAAREAVYRSGSYFDVVRARLGPALNQAIGQLVLGFPNVFAMFLLGLALGRVRAFGAIEEHRVLFRSVCRWGLLLGLPLNALSATLTTLLGAGDQGPAFWLGEAVQAIGAPLLMLGYVGSIVLLLRRGGAGWGWGNRPAGRGGLAGAVLGRLAPMGQVSLTCYLGSSLLLNLAYYGFGLGLYGRTGVAGDLLVGLVVYALLLVFSTLYAPYFRYGPAEWLWRSLTYGRRQPWIRGALAS
jgi:uncharacterized protein